MLSIITPHYNSAEKIKKLEKVLNNQTSKSFEWVIVDDYSNEQQKKELKKLKLKDNGNISLTYGEQNMGPGFARSIGIKKAKGDFITFVDSDDTVAADFVEVILKCFELENNIDVVVFDNDIITKNKVNNCNKIENIAQGWVSKDDYLKYAGSGVCGCAFRKDLIWKNNISFPDLYRFEDWVFNVNAILASNKIWYEKKILYHYIYETNSIVNSGRYDAGDYAIKAFGLLKDKLEKYNKDIATFLYMREVVYVNAVSKVKKQSYQQYKKYVGELAEYKSNVECNIHLDEMKRHHRIIVKMVLQKRLLFLYTGLKILLR